ncbi:hypothetical protein U1Q18_048748 [Sarracenia purpurea var. burkii]
MNNGKDVDIVAAMKQAPSSSSTSVSNDLVNPVHDICYAELLIQNHSNFKRSGSPARFMHYEGGFWIDFTDEVVDSFRAEFLEGKPVIEVVLGGVRHLFDFYRMFHVDLDSGNHWSVAWIDVHGKCYFPKTFIDGGGEPSNVAEERVLSGKPKIEIEDEIGEKLSASKRIKIESLGNGDEEGEEREKNVGSGSKNRPVAKNDVGSPRWPGAKWLEEGVKPYSKVKNWFMSSIGIIEPFATITAIHKVDLDDSIGRARCDVFRKQMEITEAARGEINATAAWHGTLAKGVAALLRQDFAAMPSKIPDSEARGIGKCEKIEAGSQQVCPSSVDFDTGVDDLENPNWYVVWCTNKNTHILPECVVSYKSSDRMADLLRESFLNMVAGLSSALFAKLFSKLETTIDSSRIQELRTLCITYEDGKMAKDTFLKQLQSIIGDELMVSVHEICG